MFVRTVVLALPIKGNSLATKGHTRRPVRISVNSVEKHSPSRALSGAISVFILGRSPTSAEHVRELSQTCPPCGDTCRFTTEMLTGEAS